MTAALEALLREYVPRRPKFCECADMEMDFSRPAFALAGHSFILIGDIASARVSYQRFDAGDGRVALRMGATFGAGFSQPSWARHRARRPC